MLSVVASGERTLSLDIPTMMTVLEDDFQIGFYLLSPLPLFCTCTYMVRAVSSEEMLRILGRRSV